VIDTGDQKLSIGKINIPWRMTVTGRPIGLTLVFRMAGIGASRPLRRIQAIVSFLNSQRALSLGGRTTSRC
jgi:hypothetical protein